MQPLKEAGEVLRNPQELTLGKDEAVLNSFTFFFLNKVLMRADMHSSGSIIFCHLDPPGPDDYPRICNLSVDRTVVWEKVPLYSPLPTVAGSGPLGASQPVAEADNYA